MNHFALVGYPLGHTLSPTFHNFLFDLLDIDADYQPLEVTANNLSEIAGRLRRGLLSGMNVTLPYKTTILAHLDEVAPDAAPVGAVNCVVVEGKGLVGHNTDTVAIERTLTSLEFESRQRKVLLIGTGGAARAALYVLLRQPVAHILIAGRRRTALEALTSEYLEQGSIGDITWALLGPDLDTRPYELIIHATPVGMWPRTSETPLQADQLHPGQTIFDMVYHPEQTLLLKLATERGCWPVSGLDMFIQQGLASLEWWLPGAIYTTSGTPDSRIDLGSLRKRLVTALETWSGAATA